MSDRDDTRSFSEPSGTSVALPGSLSENPAAARHGESGADPGQARSTTLPDDAPPSGSGAPESGSPAWIEPSVAAPAPARRVRPRARPATAFGFPIAAVMLVGSLLAEAAANTLQLLLYVFRRSRMKEHCRRVMCAGRALLLAALVALGAGGCTNFDKAVDETLWSSKIILGANYDPEELWWSVDKMFGLTSAGRDAESLLWTFGVIGDLK